MAPEYTRLTEPNCVREARDLTDRSESAHFSHSALIVHNPFLLVWQNIKDHVVEHMQILRRQRLERERRALPRVRCEIFVKVYRDWHKTQTDKTVLPRPVDLIFRRAELRALIAKHHDITVTEQDFEALSGHFSTWAAEWAEDCTNQLRNIVRDAPEFKGKVPEGVDPLTLASVVFTCTRCDGLAHLQDGQQVPALYPEILQHDCLWGRFHKVADEIQLAAVAVSVSSRDWYGPGTHGPWSCQPLRIGVWHRRMVEVIKICEQDPMIVAREKMDALNISLYCELCEEEEDPRTSRRAFTWWNTVCVMLPCYTHSRFKLSTDLVIPPRRTPLHRRDVHIQDSETSTCMARNHGP